PFATEPEPLERWIRETLGRVGAGGEAAPPGRLHSIPVRYDGPDLDEVARRTGLPVSEVIARHTAREYRVYLLGFVPGWAYLGDLDPALVLPRRAEPRTRVPAGRGGAGMDPRPGDAPLRARGGGGAGRGGGVGAAGGAAGADPCYAAAPGGTDPAGAADHHPAVSLCRRARRPGGAARVRQPVHLSSRTARRPGGEAAALR